MYACRAPRKRLYRIIIIVLERTYTQKPSMVLYIWKRNEISFEFFSQSDDDENKKRSDQP